MHKLGMYGEEELRGQQLTTQVNLENDTKLSGFCLSMTSYVCVFVWHSVFYHFI